MKVWASLALATTVALAACGAGGGASKAAAKPQTAEVIGTDQFRFTPSEIRVKANQQVTVRLRNTGVLIHDFLTRGQTVDAKLEAAAGQFTTGTFTAAAQPGRYEFFCAQPGHEQAGMKGTLVVE